MIIFLSYFRMNNENMSDVSEEETDPIGDKMPEPASKEK